mgnify:CR=1 FL=1
MREDGRIHSGNRRWGGLLVSVSMLALLAAVVALQRDRVPLPTLLSALALAAYAVTIRQYALVVVVAICLVGGVAVFRRHERRAAVIAVLGVIAAAVVLVGFFVWWYSVPDSKALAPAFPEGRDLRTAEASRAPACCRSPGASRFARCPIRRRVPATWCWRSRPR